MARPPTWERRGVDVGEPKESEGLLDAYEATLLELGASDPRVVVLERRRAGSHGTSAFGKRFPDRFSPVGDAESTTLTQAADLADGDRTVFASAPAELVIGHEYGVLRQSIAFPRANVKVVATQAGLPAHGMAGNSSMVEDIGLTRALPGMTVVVPADGPSTRAAIRAVAGFSGPAYVRLGEEERPTVTDGSFEIGRAATLRDGSDLTIVAVGVFVARAIEVAEELGRVGVSVRVLDFASVKPFDEKALLRAARETGAILTMEEHSVLTGVGALVASATAEEAPVPVRRVGIPDVFVEAGDRASLFDRYGMSKERCLEEAWTLLQARGKVQ